MKINVLSLFDGISAGQIALERAGIKVDNYYASEIDKYAIQITMKNYPNTIQVGDICNLDGKQFKDIDIVFGGSPCQSFSSFGNGRGFKGKSGLFFEYVRILKEVKPKYFLLENVNMKKEWQDIISDNLEVKPIALNSNLVSAQNRDRLYWTNIPNISVPMDKKILFKDVIQDVPFRQIPKCFYSKWGNKMRIEKGVNWIKNNKSNCLTTKNCHTNQYVFNEDKSLCRLLNVNEYERLQTIPNNYTEGVSNQHRFKAIGNSWTVDVIAHIFKNI